MEVNEKHLEMVNEIMDIKEKQHKALKDKMAAVKKVRAITSAFYSIVKCEN